MRTEAEDYDISGPSSLVRQHIPSKRGTPMLLGILLTGALTLLLGGRLYGRRISRAFGEDERASTPSTARADGQEYVATPTPVVFAHHFASIAGAGPIIGPVIGVLFGWLPAVLWIVLGSLLAGAVHDYSAMLISVRQGGCSIAAVARRQLGLSVFLPLIVLLIALMILVCAMFLILSAKALTSVVDAEVIGLGVDSSWIEVTATEDGGSLAHIGGIASMSVVVLTLLAPVMGWLYLKRAWPLAICSTLAVAACGLSIGIGLAFPIRIPEVSWLQWAGVSPADSPQTLWMLGLALYGFIAAGLPVWILLQSRDFLNVHILYVGMGTLVIGLLAAGLRGVPIEFPAFRQWTYETSVGSQPVTWMLWPFLFITIACGACSGFHSLCATGTTSKQVRSEPAVRQVGFYAMLLEGFLALCVVAACITGLSAARYESLLLEQNNPVLTFAVAVGMTLQRGLNLPVAAGAVFAMLLLEGFLVTTLDTAIRLSRYLLQELWTAVVGPNPSSIMTNALDSNGNGAMTPPKSKSQIALLTLLHSRWFNTGLVIGLTVWMALSGHVLTLWGLFGAGNQLLASLALLVCSAWLLAHRKPVWYTLVPATFMLTTTLVMLVQLLIIYMSAYRVEAPGEASILPLLIFDVLILSLTTTILFNIANKLIPNLLRGREPQEVLEPASQL